jgi:outer membrane protein OmpA-like peptidoglycan-associated protein
MAAGCFSSTIIFMRKLVRLLPILLLLPLSQAAFAAADPYGAPISEAIFVSFADSSAVFTPSTAQQENLTAANRAALVTVRGRTSTSKASAKDESLALARALAARAYLIAHGVSPLKIDINFASATDYLADNTTPEGKLANQRVEVEMVFRIPIAMR